MRIIYLLFDCAVTCAVPMIWLFFGLPFGALGSGILFATLFLYINVMPGIYTKVSTKFAVLAGGSDLLVTFILSVCVQSALLIYRIVTSCFTPELDVPYIIISVIVDFIIFWNGMIRCYVTSYQLGITLRVLAAVFSLIPPVNIIFLLIIIVKTRQEYLFERKYGAMEREKAAAHVCATRFPIMLVHGVFFRDTKAFNYWGRVPKAIERCGGTVLYGNQQSALSVAQSASELAAKIEQTVMQLGCGKVNIIAHSKGGLDSRYAISLLGADKYVATLTTVCTPHRGCMFVEKMYDSIPEPARLKMAAAYNAAARTVGDTSPDFLSAVGDLRESACARMNSGTPDSPLVSYRSIGSYAKNSRGGKFPMNVSYLLVKKTDGANDGLVSVESMKWGESFRLVSPPGRRGITHADMIDLNRENIKGFDIRSFYIDLVSELKNQGY